MPTLYKATGREQVTRPGGQAPAHKGVDQQAERGGRGGEDDGDQRPQDVPRGGRRRTVPSPEVMAPHGGLHHPARRAACHHNGPGRAPRWWRRGVHRWRWRRRCAQRPGWRDGRLQTTVGCNLVVIQVVRRHLVDEAPVPHVEVRDVVVLRSGCQFGGEQHQTSEDASTGGGTVVSAPVRSMGVATSIWCCEHKTEHQRLTVPQCSKIHTSIITTCNNKHCNTKHCLCHRAICCIVATKHNMCHMLYMSGVCLWKFTRRAPA